MKRLANGTAVVKCLVAWVTISALLAWPIHDIRPGMGLAGAFAAALGLSLAVLGLLVLMVVPTLQFEQWKLRHGAIDTQWLWFRADPPGLEGLRAGGAGAPPPPGDQKSTDAVRLNVRGAPNTK